MCNFTISAFSFPGNMMIIIFYFRLGCYKLCSSAVGEIGDQNMLSSFSFHLYRITDLGFGETAVCSNFPFQEEM